MGDFDFGYQRYGDEEDEEEDLQAAVIISQIFYQTMNF